MIAALDVHYDEASSKATAAAVIFQRWDDAEPIAQYTAGCEVAEAYVPGEFFRRELPCLLAVLKQIQETLSLILIDGYVTLGDKPGLGMRLWEALPLKMPVIGVAKRQFQNAAAIEVTRGESKIPLFVTAVDIAPAKAADSIRKMHGPFRIPTMLKRADRLARERAGEAGW